MSGQRRLSDEDVRLLAAELPPAKVVSIAAPIYPGGRGEMEYREAGLSGRPVIVLLHGLGSSSAGYRAQLAGLAERFRVIAWNAPGYGVSTALAKDDPDVGDYVIALRAFLETLQAGPLACLLGSSWGSVIALAYVERFPDGIDCLMLSSPNTARGDLAGADRERELAAALPSPETFAGADRSAVARRLLPPDAPAQVRGIVERLRDTVTYRGWCQAVGMMFSTYTPELIGAVRTPIAILAGALDVMAPLEQHAIVLHEAASEADLVIFEGCGHMPKIEMPSSFNEAITTALRRAKA